MPRTKTRREEIAPETEDGLAPRAAGQQEPQSALHDSRKDDPRLAGPAARPASQGRARRRAAVAAADDARPAAAQRARSSGDRRPRYELIGKQALRPNRTHYLEDSHARPMAHGAGAANPFDAACTRRVSAARLAPTSGQVVTEFQSDSSRTDSPVRIRHAQPRSRVSEVSRECCSGRARRRAGSRYVVARAKKPNHFLMRAWSFADFTRKLSLQALRQKRRPQ